MARIFRIVVVVFIFVSTVAWTAYTVYFVRHASDRARKACAGKTILGGEDAYYWCIQRVEAGREP